MKNIVAGGCRNPEIQIRAKLLLGTKVEFRLFASMPKTVVVGLGDETGKKTNESRQVLLSFVPFPVLSDQMPQQHATTSFSP